MNPLGVKGSQVFVTSALLLDKAVSGMVRAEIVGMPWRGICALRARLAALLPRA